MKRVIAILMMFLFIGILPVMAQSEGTLSVEPVATTEPAATVEATAPAPVEDEKPVVPANTTGTIFLILIPILSVGLAGGGVMAMVMAFRRNQAAVSASEQLGNSVPQPIAERMLTIIDTMQAGLNAGREALDRVPAAEKPATFANFTTDALILEIQQRGYIVSARTTG